MATSSHNSVRLFNYRCRIGLLKPGVQGLRRPKLPGLHRDLQAESEYSTRHLNLPLLRREILQNNRGQRIIVRHQRSIPMQRRSLERRLQQLREANSGADSEALRASNRGAGPAQRLLYEVRDLRVQAGERYRVAVQDLRVDSGEWGWVWGQAGLGAGGDSERRGGWERRVLRRRVSVGVCVGSV